MVFKRLLMAFGVGGPSVDTVLTSPHTRPGAAIEGRVELSGGDSDVLIEEIALCLAANVEAESDGGEHEVGAEFARVPVAGAFRLAAGEHRAIPFSYPVPWDAPLTDAGGGLLPGSGLGLRTEVVIDRAADKGDLDRVHVHPLPAQDRVLEAFARLGFGLKHTDIEIGHLAGTAQQSPFFQEIEFHPAPHYAHEIGEVELSFVADPHGVDVVIEFDKRGGMFTEGQDLYGRFRVEHAHTDHVDWAAQVDAWITEALERHRGLFGGYGRGHDEQPDHGYDGYHQAEERGGALGGLGGVALGVAGGLAAGYVAAEVVDEIGDMFEGEEAEEEEEE
ncbi:sporulation protein [Actinorugispora endophytica]|uniref:Sporulation-control protein n=1 Tax=Actinorugispora endophytica TaxID=1605990 RepID=A0A4R6UZT6_9ACTN|nr:sporulation protein [Actinorugispora endophytica]TDQ52915.1 sporulation-control protein [Actinorugispora endophytica]